MGLVCWRGCGVTHTVTMKVFNQPRRQRGHATDLTAAVLEALGVPVGQALPSESTIRRVLQDLAQQASTPA